MRKAFELAWANACVYRYELECQTKPNFRDLSETGFALRARLVQARPLSVSVSVCPCTWWAGGR